MNEKWNFMTKHALDVHHTVYGSSCRVKTPMFRRPLALGAAGGSLSSLALRLLTESVSSVVDPSLPVPLPDLSCACPTSLDLPATGLDLRSLLIGLVVGLSLGPLLELLLVVRHWWTSLIRRQLQSLARGLRPLYREL